jgi:hypothetical protein
MRALNDLPGKTVDAARLAAAVCRVHPDYTGGRTGEVEATLQGLGKGEEKDAEAWLAEVDGLIDAKAARVIDTRLLLFALALLDGEVFRVLYHGGAIEPLIDELTTAASPPGTANTAQQHAR